MNISTAACRSIRSACVALILAAISTSVAGAQQSAQGASRDNGQATKGTLILQNARQGDIQLEVRVGDSPNCADNPLIGLLTLRPKRTWGISTEKSVCWRVVAPESAGLPATEWARRTVVASQRTTESVE